ncbi:MAG: hypothetical protein CVU60_10565 [Deltaproteobacteria bacterium HGW-Deltaproteobacteria-18]|nr:MAG: hypothetical protein CVU60_10565 [Deltaproteobacteria bacterium HGW-Deltaproteobacteria-18]
MQIKRKNIPAATVLEAAATLTIPEIAVFAGKVIPMLVAEIENRELAVTGPCFFTYDGCNGSPDKEFSLQVAFPVDACRGQGAFICKEIPAHECLCTEYRGPISGIGLAWNAFTSQALQQGLALQPLGREVYVHWIDQDSPENLVELQIPLQG